MHRKGNRKFILDCGSGPHEILSEISDVSFRAEFVLFSLFSHLVKFLVRTPFSTVSQQHQQAELHLGFISSIYNHQDKGVCKSRGRGWRWRYRNVMFNRYGLYVNRTVKEPSKGSIWLFIGKWANGFADEFNLIMGKSPGERVVIRI